MLLAALPAAKLTGQRCRVLKRIVDRLPHDELRHDQEDQDQDDQIEEADEIDEACEVEEARASLHRQLDQLAQFPSDRDVTLLRLSDWPYPLWFTGGMSWGDAPTEAFDTFLALGSASPIFEQLRTWVLEDAANDKSRPAAGATGATAATAHDILREFVDDVRIVYGRDGDSLDEELLDWPDLVATYHKARALLGRDSTSSTTNQEKDH